MTTDKLDAIWWNGYEKGAIDSAYEMYDLGCAAAIDEMVSPGGDISSKMSIFERKKKDSRMQTKKQYHCHRRWSGSLIIYHTRRH